MPGLRIMVNRNTSQGNVMDEGILDEIIVDLLEESGNDTIYARGLIDRLESYGFMIVPIEDPTNLRYGADD